MAKDRVPIRATTSPSHSINPLKSPSKSEASLPPPPAKHKRLSFPTFHHHDGLTNELSNYCENAKSKTENDSEKIDVVKDRRTSSALKAVPTTGIPKRPTMGQINRQNSVQTRYMTMLLHLDEIPRLHNILASFFTVRFLTFTPIFALQRLMPQTVDPPRRLRNLPWDIHLPPSRQIRRQSQNRVRKINSQHRKTRSPPRCRSHSVCSRCSRYDMALVSLAAELCLVSE